jgi:hypothetical protein
VLRKMKPHESNKTINSIIAPPIKPTRFRFPFKKSSFSMQQAGAGLGGSPPMSHKSPTNSGLYNLGRKLGFKPTSPTLRYVNYKEQIVPATISALFDSVLVVMPF